MHSTDGDRPLLERLRDLARLDPDALLEGVAPSEQADLLRAHVEDLQDALTTASNAMDEMRAVLGRGPSPMGWMSGPAEDVRQHAEAAAERLRQQAELCRNLAVLSEAASLVVPRLAEGAARRGSVVE